MAETELTLVYFDALCDALSLPLGPLLLLGGPSGAWFVPYMAAFAFGRVACLGACELLVGARRRRARSAIGGGGGGRRAERHGARGRGGGVRRD